ncbi:hypothetical protein [Salinithrix halophila]|uniref:Protein-export membrane protein SecG n=1 Tax=Salinithrix halophila TaxID=1485204 RepID=A0ABV8JCV8_9BACL
MQTLSWVLGIIGALMLFASMGAMGNPGGSYRDAHVEGMKGREQKRVDRKRSTVWLIGGLILIGASICLGTFS